MYVMEVNQGLLENKCSALGVVDFPIKSQTADVLGFAGNTVMVTTSPLCHSGQKSSYKEYVDE